MKKYSCKAIALLLASLVALTACGGPADGSQENSGTGYAYSNLADDESRALILAAMESGAAGKRAAGLFEQVSYFNEAVAGYGLVDDGFTGVIESEPPYDPYEMQDLWDAKHPDFMGYNCRITSFYIMQDLITIGDAQPDESDFLLFDEQSIAKSPLVLFDEARLYDFRTLYYAIPTENTKEEAVHAQKVAGHFEERGIAFHENGISLVEVYFHDEEGYLFVGHVGVLMATDSGYIFIEKIAFQEPYQAVQFESRAQLRDYLMTKYDVAWGQETARPFIVENGRLMQ